MSAFSVTVFLWGLGRAAPVSARAGVFLPGQPARIGAQISATRYHTAYLPLVFHGFSYRLEPNDPMFLLGQQWGLEQVHAPEGWYLSTGHAVTVAIVDSGVDLDHPDLVNSLWVNPGEIPGNGIDDDGNGRVDDVHGWDFVGNDGTPDDVHGHGTHVAGIAGATTDNGIGVAGIGWGARVMAVRVLGDDGIGGVWEVAQGIRYAADNGAQVINLSLGECYADFSEVAEAVAHAQGLGALVVAAAGNTYGTCAFYPAAHDGVLGVAATDSSDQRAAFSTYGSHVDIAAPGVGIQSTTIGGSYGTKSGTSMATPMVSGLAALLWTYCPGATSAQIAQAIADGAEDLGASGWDPYFGWGRIDASRMNCPAATTSASLAPVSGPESAVEGTLTSFRPGEVIVALDLGMSLQSLGHWQVLDANERSTSYLIRVPVGSELSAVRQLRERLGVRYAHLNYVLRAVGAGLH